jgi:hypothetical protein
MFILIERFGQSYTFNVEEGLVPVDDGDNDRDQSADQETPTAMPKFTENPEICLLDAVDALNNLLRCVFPELEGHHLEVICDNPESDTAAGDGGIDLRKK